MKKLIAIACCILLSHYSFGWAAKGHKIVALIAKQCLTQPIIDSVQSYLGTMSFEDAAVWMDVIKSDHQYDNLKPWHYVNVDRDKTYVREAGKDNNVIEALRTSIKTLTDRKSPYRKKLDFDIKVLFHLVGDIHQPLHCGYGEDRGGNDIDVKFLGQHTNLHEVWDNAIIEYTGITVSDCLKTANDMSAEEKKQIQTLDVEVWAKEARELLPGVYDFDKKIGKDYAEKNKPVIEKQLAKAGIRLAYVLHQAFSK